MDFILDGRTHRLTFSEFCGAWDDQPERREFLRGLAKNAEIRDSGGVLLSGLVLQRVRERLLRQENRDYVQSYRDDEVLRHPWSYHRQEDQTRRWLVEELWPWGTIPALAGNAKAGKSLLVADLVHALALDDYPFLGRFPQVEMDHEERNAGVLVINAEVRPEIYEAEVFKDLPEHLETVGIYHLENLGGAHVMNLLDDDLFNEWSLRLTECMTCDGTDDVAPTVVIVDGVTAILQAAGRSMDDFGPWFARFKLLLRSCAIENGLVVAHAPREGGHLYGGVSSAAGPDGLWDYSCTDPDAPGASRHFAVVPRMGGAAVPRTRVDLGDDGRLRLRDPGPRGGGGQGSDGPREDPAAATEERVLADLTAYGSEGVLRSALTGSGAAGRYRREALDRLVERGEAVERPEPGSSRGRRIWASEHAPSL